MVKAEVSIIGAGVMGAAMAERLIQGGFRVNIYNRTACKLKKLVMAGALVMGAIDEAFKKGRGVWILCLRDEASITDLFSKLENEAVETGGIKNTGKKLIVNTSTVGAEASRRLEHFFAVLGVEYVEMPVSGGAEGALTGNLVGYVGKMPESLKPEFVEVMDILLSDYCQMPSNGQAQAMKVINNYCESIHLVAAAEALVLAESLGLEKKVIGDSLAMGRGSSIYLELLLNSYMSVSYTSSVTMDIRIKDLVSAGELLSLLNLKSSLYDVVHKVYERVASSAAKVMDQMEIYDYLSRRARAMQRGE